MSEPILIETPALTIAESFAALEHRVLHLTDTPSAVDMLAHSMAVVLDSQWREGRHPDWLLLIGPPSEWKTEALMCVRCEHTHFVDTLASSRSFLSGMVDMKSGARARNFLAELHNRTLVIKDLTALLSEDPKHAKSILGSMTNHFDGEFNKVIGTALNDTTKSATIGGKCRYSFVAAVTPAIFAAHSETITGMGARVLCYIMPKRAPESVKDLSRRLAKLQRTDLKADYDALYAHAREHLTRVLAEHAPLEFSQSEAVQDFLAAATDLVIRGRRAMRWTETPSDEGRTERDWAFWDVEGPYRAYQQLSIHLALLTRLAGRTEPNAQDMERLAYLALGTAAFARAQVLLEVRERPTCHEGQWGVLAQDVKAALGISLSHAEHLLSLLVKSGLLTTTRIKTGKVGAPALLYHPLPDHVGLFWGGAWGLPDRLPGLSPHPQTEAGNE